MGSLWFVGARAAAQRWFLAALVTVVLVVTAGLTTMTVFLADAAQAGIRSTVDEAPMSGRAVQLTTELGTDEVAQDVAARQLFATAFAGSPVSVDRAVVGAQLAVVPARQSRPSAPTTVVEPRIFLDLARHARIVAGSWPVPVPAAGGGIAIAAPADPTAASGWRVGDRATIAGDESGTVLRVAALYRPLDALDPYFLPQPGGTSATPQLVAVGSSDLKMLSSSPSALWTISPDTSRLVVADAQPMAHAVTALARLAGNDPDVDVRGVRVSGGLPDTLATVLGSLAAVRGVAVLPILLTAGLGVVLIVVLLAALVRTRRQELLVLRGRGLGPARLTAWSTAEGALLAIPAVLAGTGLSVWIRPWVQSPAGSASAGPIPWWPSALMIAAVLAASAALTLLECRSAAVRPRSAAVGSIVPVVLVLAAGAVTVWRFRASGSAVLTDASGTTTVDPVAAPAPAIGLLALALLGTLLAAIAARTTAAAAGRRRGLGVVLPAREVSRRWATFGAAGTVVSLAVAASVLTAAYDGTQRSFAHSAALLGNGADVRVDLPDSFVDAGVEPAAAGLPSTAIGGVLRSAGALVAPVTVGSAAGQLVAVPAADLAAFVPAIAGGYDPVAIARQLSASVLGPRLPGGARTVTVGLTVTAAAARPDPRNPQSAPPAAGAVVGVHPVLWIATRGGLRAVQGAELRVPVSSADAVPVPARAQVAIALPPEDPAGGGATVVAVDTVLDTHALDTVDTVQIDGIPATPGTVPASWTVAALQDGADAVSAQGSAPDMPGWAGPVLAAALPRTIRLVPSAADAVGPAPVPMVVNRLMADQLGAAVGNPLDLRLDATGSHVLGRVTAISPVLPGDPAVPRAMADRAAVAAQLLWSTTVVPDANQIWISTAAPADLAAGLRGAAGPGRVVEIAGGHSTAALIDPARTALWIGVAVFLLLTLLAVALMAGTSSRDRRGEIRPLVAAGLTRRQLIGLRRRELLWCFVIGALLGVAVGIVTSVLTVGGLARSAVVGAPPQLDPALRLSAGLWPALGAGVVGAVLVIVGYGRLNAAHWIRAVR